METISVPFSQLIREPVNVLNKLAQTPNGKLRLVRRDGESLMLMSEDKAAAEARAREPISRLFIRLLETDDGVRNVVQALPDVFLWLRFLPPEKVREFTAEFIETARACAAIDNYTALDTAVTVWRDTAEIHSDPELHTIFTRSPHNADSRGVPQPFKADLGPS